MADHFFKYKNLYSSTLSTGIGTGTGETITPASVSGVPTDTAVTLIIDRVDASGTATPTKMEGIRGTIAGGNLTSYTRAVVGTEQAHLAGAVVEMVWNAADWNETVDGILIAHNQDGTIKTNAVIATNAATLTSPKVITGINDTNNNELIKMTATTSAVNEVTLANAATNNSPTLSATGSDSNIGLDVKTKGTGRLRKPTIVGVQVVDAGTDTATGDGKAFFRVPAELNGMNLTGVAATVYTAGTTNTTDIQLRNKTDSVDMLSTKITIDSGETDTSTAATAAVIDTSKDDVATGDIIAVDVDAISTTAAKGLYVELRFELP